jgi:hypothetical protein
MAIRQMAANSLKASSCRQVLLQRDAGMSDNPDGKTWFIPAERATGETFGNLAGSKRHPWRQPPAEFTIEPCEPRP